MCTTVDTHGGWSDVFGKDLNTPRTSKTREQGRRPWLRHREWFYSRRPKRTYNQLYTILGTSLVPPHSNSLQLGDAHVQFPIEALPPFMSVLCMPHAFALLSSHVSFSADFEAFPRCSNRRWTL